MTVGHYVYLVAMVSIIVAVTAIGANTLLVKRCPECGARNIIDAARCRHCARPFTGNP